MAGSKNTDISRSRWTTLFERGFKRGATGQDVQPDVPHDELQPSDAAESTAEMKALESGHEAGKKNRAPGTNVDIDELANAAYDRSEFSTGLGRWSE